MVDHELPVQQGKYRQYFVLAPAIILLVSSFYLLSTYNYLLYHSLVELLAVMVALTILHPPPRQAAAPRSKGRGLPAKC